MGRKARPRQCGWRRKAGLNKDFISPSWGAEEPGFSLHLFSPSLSQPPWALYKHGHSGRETLAHTREWPRGQETRHRLGNHSAVAYRKLAQLRVFFFFVVVVVVFFLSASLLFFPVWLEQIGTVMDDGRAHRGQGCHAGYLQGLPSRPTAGSPRSPEEVLLKH